MEVFYGPLAWPDHCVTLEILYEPGHLQLLFFFKGKIDTFYDPDIPSLPLGKVGPKKGDILTRCAGLGITTSSFTCLHCLKVESKKNRYHTFMQRR